MKAIAIKNALKINNLILKAMNISIDDLKIIIKVVIVILGVSVDISAIVAGVWMNKNRYNNEDEA
jgi:hypothetical protein